MGQMADATEGYMLLEALKQLARSLAADLDECREMGDLKLVPQLSRQYRETMVKIDELEGGEDDDDEIAAIILRNRKSSSD